MCAHCTAALYALTIEPKISKTTDFDFPDVVPKKTAMPTSPSSGSSSANDTGGGEGNGVGGDGNAQGDIEGNDGDSEDGDGGDSGDGDGGDSEDGDSVFNLDKSKMKNKKFTSPHILHHR